MPHTSWVQQHDPCSWEGHDGETRETQSPGSLRMGSWVDSTENQMGKISLDTTKILNKTGIPDYLTWLLRNLYASQEVTVRTGYGIKKWFIVSRLTFRSLIHFEFIFVYGVRKCSSFILLQVVDQFFQHHLLKRLSFFHCISLPPLSKIRCP